jgi:hypothetical protein
LEIFSQKSCNSLFSLKNEKYILFPVKSREFYLNNQIKKEIFGWQKANKAAK